MLYLFLWTLSFYVACGFFLAIAVVILVNGDIFKYYLVPDSVTAEHRSAYDLLLDNQWVLFFFVTLFGLPVMLITMYNMAMGKE